jgi:PAS domain S-box-containing protein
MNNKIHEKSKQELLHELNDLKNKYDAIEQLYHNQIEESRQTEKTLQENQANIKAIIENSLESVWSIDLNYNIQYINEIFASSFQQTFGVHLEKGVNLLNSLPEHLKAIWKERYDRAFNNEHFVFTDKIELENSSVYIEVSTNPILYDGKVVGASFFGKDISERMRTEEALLESETRFKALHNASFGGIAIHDKGKIIECNQGLAAMTGYTYEELSGMDGLLLIAEKSRDFVRNKILSGEEKPYEAIGRRKNGEEFPMMLEARNVPYKGKIVRTTEFRDITEQKQAEKSLKERDEIFRHFMENSPVYVFFKDKEIRVLNLSKNYEQMLGLPLDEMLGKTMDDLFPSELAKKMIADDKKILKERNHVIVDEELNGRFYTTIKFPIIIDDQPQFLAGYTIDITERKKAEDTLRNSEERLKILFNYAPEAYYLLDLKGNFADGNFAAEKLIGYNKNELIGKSFFELNILSPVHLITASEILGKGIAGNPTGPDELELIRKDGKIVTVEITTHPVKIEGKTLILGIVRDISERKRAEIAMKQASENWNRTFQAMHSGIALLDSDQRIIQTNQAFQNFLAENDSTLTGKYCFPLILGDRYSFVKNPFERMKVSMACETSEILLNGRTYEILVDPILDNDKSITGAVLIMNDITQRKRDEHIQQILHEITGTQMLDKSIGELLFIVRNELSKVLDVTNFFVALYQPETDTLRKVIFEDEKDDFFEWDAGKSLSGQVMKLGKPLLLNSEEEARFAAENNIELLGSPAACWLGVPLLSGEKTIGVLVVQSYTNENAYDNATIRLLILIAHELSIIIERNKMIVDLVAAKDKAEESDRLKSAFLANMSHEIRTPMNGILGFAELLKEPKLSGEEQQMFIEIIEKSGERMLGIINDLINISKIESGQMEIRFSETNINDQLEFLYNFFKLEAKQKRLKLIVNHPLSNENSNIITDKEKLYAILTNLIKNSLKFTKRGSIEFGYRVAESELIFYVKDTGIGVPENKQKTIFERFVQASSGMSSVYEGAGLGLAISKAYVEMLDGKIWIESKPDSGTCFYFTLPLKLETEIYSEKTDEKAVVFENDGNKITVLIAEDDEISIIYLSHILKACNMEILVAKTGGEAVEMSRKFQQIALILMDINLPVFDGQIAAQIIKGFRPELPIIAQTAYALIEDKERYNDTFDDYITKPVKADELQQKMRKVLNCTNL